MEALQGSQRAYGLLYARHLRLVHHTIATRVRCPDEADDLVQMTFLRAFLALDRFRGEAALSTWLSRIAVNVCNTHVQARRERRDAFLEALEVQTTELRERERSHPVDPEERLLRKERRQLIVRGIRSLPGRYRKAMWLRYVRDRSYTEIGRELRVPMGTVKTWLCRGRRKLRGELEKREHDGGR
ncbi:MAG: sigma-70 family RNA polymerase sigma factor [Candidatus Latescibacteria bacterium]|nr:sigma-70 family RNA polymerase sigma factor [Candidatus Latescibacterota bacterium]